MPQTPGSAFRRISVDLHAIQGRLLLAYRVRLLRDTKLRKAIFIRVLSLSPTYSSHASPPLFSTILLLDRSFTFLLVTLAVAI